MRNEALRDSVKVWIYAAATVLLGAALAPWFYNLGKALAEVTDGKRTNGVVEALAAWCRAADLGWFFKQAWAFAAIVLFMPAVSWLRLGDGDRARRGPWTVVLSGRGHPRGHGQPLEFRSGGPRDCLRGIGISFALVAGLGLALIAAGSFGWRGFNHGALVSCLRLLPVALGLAIVQEIVFRGFALGVFLRSSPPWVAMAMAALLYALAGFLLAGNATVSVAPEDSAAGFWWLAAQCKRLGDPFIAAGILFPWWAFGCILGYARWRTANLWLPVGLHAGWIFGNGLFLSMAVPFNQPDPIARVLAGASLREGLIPLIGVALVGIALHFLFPAMQPDHETE